MNVLLRATCVEILDKAFSSPLGSLVVVRLQMLSNLETPAIAFLNIKNKIIQNEFSSLKEFIKYVTDTCENLIQFIGPNEEISIAIESVLQEIVENTTPFIPTEETNWKEVTKGYIQSLEKSFNSIPDDKAAFSSQISNSSIENYLIPDKSSLLENTPDVDPVALIDKIQRIKKDADIEYIAFLLMNFEPLITQSEGYVNINLTQCSQQMLKLIDNYVKKCELKVPPPPHPLPPRPNTPTLSFGVSNSPTLSSLKMLPQSLLQSFLMLSNNKIQRSNSESTSFNRPQTPPATPLKSPPKPPAPNHSIVKNPK